MAVKKGRKKPHAHYTRGKRGDTAELSEMLAPLEEKDPAQAQQQQQSAVTAEKPAVDGAMIIDSSKLSVPSDFDGSEPRRILGVEPVVLAIIVVMLAFIGFIAYLISIEQPRT